MSPLTLAELTVNMEHEGLHRLKFKGFDTLKHPRPTEEQKTHGKQVCPHCRGLPRAAILFNDLDAGDAHWFAECMACGHCERL